MNKKIQYVDDMNRYPDQTKFKFERKTYKSNKIIIISWTVTISMAVFRMDLILFVCVDDIRTETAYLTRSLGNCRLWMLFASHQFSSMSFSYLSIHNPFDKGNWTSNQTEPKALPKLTKWKNGKLRFLFD